IYWQLLLGASALLAWFVQEPHTTGANLAYIFFLGSVLNIVFNANPLIKLDGYYFLSQWLRLPNLMDRFRDFLRGLLRRVVQVECNREATRFSRRERVIFAIYWPLSFAYAVALRSF